MKVALGDNEQDPSPGGSPAQTGGSVASAYLYVRQNREQRLVILGGRGGGRQSRERASHAAATAKAWGEGEGPLGACVALPIAISR